MPIRGMHDKWISGRGVNSFCCYVLVHLLDPWNCLKPHRSSFAFEFTFTFTLRRFAGGVRDGDVPAEPCVRFSFCTLGALSVAIVPPGAVSVVDVLPTRLASVYTFYNPDYRYMEWGKYTALREIFWTQQVCRLCLGTRWELRRGARACVIWAKGKSARCDIPSHHLTSFLVLGARPCYCGYASFAFSAPDVRNLSWYSFPPPPLHKPAVHR
jgi:hypothetical protein